MSSSPESSGSQGIRVRDLVVRYGRTLAVDRLSLDVPLGRITALLGPNGAGKTSTVRCIVGVQQPDSGTITVCGHDVGREPQAAKSRIGYVPETGSLYEALTAVETLLLKGRLHGLPDESILARSHHLLGVMGIEERATDPIAAYSKGMRQKVVLAAALLTDPDVLILDEPLSGLDAETTQVVKELLALLTERDKAVLYCSHLLDVVERVAERVLILSDGSLVAAGTLDELRRDPATARDPSLEGIFRQVTRAPDPRRQAERLLAWPGSRHALERPMTTEHRSSGRQG